jgi:LysM repeat protein
MFFRTLKSKRHNVIILLVLVIHVTAFCQFKPAKVEPSDEKIIYKGKLYYVHIVKEGQTLYSISQAYNVTDVDIAKANPETPLNIIKPGQVLRIPVVTSARDVSESDFGHTSEDFIYHIVKKGETVYSIHNKYNVTLEEIYYYNPGAKNSIKTGQQLRIPRKKEMSTVLFKPAVSDTSYTTHRVVAGDSLYRLAEKYHTTEAEIITSNPELRWGLKKGMVLKIPESKLLLVSKGLDSIGWKSGQYDQRRCDSLKFFHESKSVKIALVLPFNAKKQSFIQEKDSLSLTEKRINAKSTTYIEFYEGVLLAIDSLKKNDISINLFVYDNENDTIKQKKIIDELKFIEPDMIIGPAGKENIRLVLQYSKENNIPLILPFTRNQDDIKDNPLLFQVIPGMETEMKQYADFLSRYYTSNIILIHDEDSTGLAQIKKFKQLMINNLSSVVSPDSIHIRIVRYNDVLKDSLAPALKSGPDEKNIVLIISSSQAYVVDLMTQLRTQMRYKNVETFGLPAWQSFKTSRIEHYHDLNLKLYTPFYIDYSKKHTMAFVKMCREKLGFEPYKTLSRGLGLNVTMLGYDVMFYFLDAYITYGPLFTKCISCYHPDLIMSDYTFEKISPEGGFENKHVTFLNYTRDFEVQKIH